VNKPRNGGTLRIRFRISFLCDKTDRTGWSMVKAVMTKPVLHYQDNVKIRRVGLTVLDIQAVKIIVPLSPVF
jgi:hypothetical protein